MEMLQVFLHLLIVYSYPQRKKKTVGDNSISNMYDHFQDRNY